MTRSMRILKEIVAGVVVAALVISMSGLTQLAEAATSCNDNWYTTFMGVTYRYSDKLETFTSYRGKTYAYAKKGTGQEKITTGLSNGKAGMYDLQKYISSMYPGASLPVVSDGGVQQMLIDVFGPQITASSQLGAYVGEVNMNDGNGYINLDGSGPATFYNWALGQPNPAPACTDISGTAVKDPYVFMLPDGTWKTICEGTVAPLFVFDGVFDCATPYTGTTLAPGTGSTNIPTGPVGNLRDCDINNFELFTLDTNRTFAVTKNPMTWSEAKTLATSAGGKLAFVNDILTNDYLTTTYSPYMIDSPNVMGGKKAWIGLYDPASVASWCMPGTSPCPTMPQRFQWADGGVSSFSNWSPGQPDNYCTSAEIAANVDHNCFGENWAALSFDGKWYDEGDHGTSSTKLKAIVQWRDQLTCTSTVKPPDVPTPPGSLDLQPGEKMCTDSAKSTVKYCQKTDVPAPIPPQVGCPTLYANVNGVCTASMPCPNGACTVPGSPVCPAWASYDAATNMCVGIDNQICPLEQVVCTDVVEDPSCPDGGALNPDRHMCQLPPTVSCGTGYVWDRTIDRCVAPITCPENGQYNQTTQLCEKVFQPTCTNGYTLEGVNRCVMPATCPQGGVLSPTTNRCEMPVTWVCTSPGYSYNAATRRCEIPPLCPAGSVYSVAAQRCEQAPSNCPVGYSYSMALDVCIADVSCPNGGTFSAVSNSCELPGTPACEPGWSYNQTTTRCEQAPKCAAPGVYDPASDLCLTDISGAACPANYVYDPATRSCTEQPTCAAGTFNPTANRCEVAPDCAAGFTYNSAVGRCEQAPIGCPSGYSYNSSLDVCTASVVCPNGGTLNNSTNLCELQITLSCNAGWVLNTSTSKCEQAPACTAPGTYNTGSKNCTAAVASIVCPTGYTWNAANKVCTEAPICVSGTSYNSTTKKCESVPICGPGAVINTTTGRCELAPNGCASGFTYNATLNLCVAAADCTGGSLDVASGKCVATATPVCSGGWVYNAAKLRCENPPLCAAPGVFDATSDKCVTSVSSFACPVGFTYNNAAATCTIAPNCAAGTTYSSATKTCITPVSYTCSDSSYFYNTTTSRCEKTPVCTAGTYNTTYNKCLLATVPGCAAGYLRNLTTGRCEKQPECPVGTVYDTTYNRCEVTPLCNLKVCPTGSTLNITTNKCEVPMTAPYTAAPSYSCPLGNTLTGNSTCLGTYAASVIYDCPSGGGLQGTMCVTTSSYGGTRSYTLNNNGYSGKNNVNLPQLSVFPGSVRINGTCFSSLDACGCFGQTTVAQIYSNARYYHLCGSWGTYTCPTGGVLGPDGITCTKTSQYGATVTNTCPSGGTLSGAVCNTSNSATLTYHCPNGGTLNGMACVYACPTGMAYNSGTGNCEGDPAVVANSNFNPATSVCDTTYSASISGATLFNTPFGYTGTTVAGTGCVKVPAANPTGDATCASQVLAYVASAPAAGLVSVGYSGVNNGGCLYSFGKNVSGDATCPAHVLGNIATSQLPGLIPFGYSGAMSPTCKKSLAANPTGVTGCLAETFGYAAPTPGAYGGTSSCTSGGTLNGTTCTATTSPYCPANAALDTARGRCYVNPTCTGGNFDGTADVCWTDVIASCPAGTTWDNTLGYCSSAATCSNGLLDGNADLCYQNFTPSCPSGSTNVSGTCVATPTCSSGVFDPALNACKIAGTPQCSAGYSMDVPSGKCIQTPSCAPGNLDAAANVCYATNTLVCGTGFTLVQQSIGDWCEKTPVCLPGSVYNSPAGLCASTGSACSTGYTLDPNSDKCYAAGTCQAGLTLLGAVCSTSASCDTGGALDLNLNLCSGAATFNCAAGYTYSAASGVCNKTADCGGGGLNVVSDKCEIAFTPTCPSGYLVNGSTCQLAPTCSAGATYDPVSKLCLSTTTPCSVGSLDPTVDKCFTGPTCTGGYSINGNLCTGSAICGPGGALDTATSLCRGAASFSCPVPFGYSPASGKCFLAPTCTPGNLDMVSDVCATANTLACPASFVLNGSMCQIAPTCGLGGVYNPVSHVCDGGSDVCPVQWGLDTAKDVCYFASSCPPGGTFDISTNQCFLTATPTCPDPGNKYAYDVATDLCATPPVCTPGAYDPATDVCAMAITPDCGPSYAFDAGRSVCTKIVACPADLAYKLNSTIAFSPSLNMCASDADHVCVPTYTYNSVPVTQCEAVPICTRGAFNPLDNSCSTGSGNCPLGDYQCLPVAGDPAINPATQQKYLYCSPNTCTDNTQGMITNDDTTTGANDPADDGLTDQYGNCLSTLYLYPGKDMRCRVYDKNGQINSYAKLVAQIVLAATGVGAALAGVMMGVAAAQVGLTVAGQVLTAAVNAALTIASNVAIDAATGQLGQGTLIAAAMTAATVVMSAASAYFSAPNTFVAGATTTTTDTATGMTSTVTNNSMTTLQPSVFTEGAVANSTQGMTLISKVGGVETYSTAFNPISGMGNLGGATTMVTVSTAANGVVSIVNQSVSTSAASMNALLMAQATKLADQWGPAMATGMLSNYSATHCCYPDKMGASCNKDEFQEAKLQHGKMCHIVGTYCSSKFLGWCLVSKQTSCCFNSMLARIFHEQGRPQLKSFGEPLFGYPKSPRCRGFLQDEFQNLDFGQMDLSEYVEKISADAETLKGDIGAYMESVGTNTENKMKSLGVPAL